ncbi:MAG: 2-amino-4-hydroxy-6-hydroxymethyldihydropteridine diphosphokinase [Chloroflexota bacterium]
MTYDVYLALGTNLGDRLANLRAALRSLPPDIQPVSVSRIFETPPWGFTDQPAFLNMAIHARTRLEPEALLRKLKTLEVELGREQTFRWGPRLIDLDILFYDDLVLDTPPLVIPHPRLHERGFVLVPLIDIAPDLVHPVLGKTIRQLLAEIDAADIVPFTAQIETTVTPKS